jgi:two-component system probable response regulator PhcQ
LLEKHKDEIAALMTDQRMPGEKGVWLLERARQLRPRMIRILVTAYSDMDAAIAAVNTGSIYKYITKPWDPPQLESTLKRGLEFFIVQRERDQLLKEKMSVLHNIMITDRIISLGLLAAGLSHHIRNSLVAVKTFLDLAPAKLREENIDLNGLRNPQFWRDYYHNVQGQIDKINAMLRDLLTASERPSAPFQDQINAREEIQDVLAHLREAVASKGIRVENKIPDTLPVLRVEKPKFRRLFELLLKDEIVSLPAGSRITLEAESIASTTPGGPDIQFIVRDNGPGLPKESLRLIFDPFALRSDSPLEYGINLMAVYFIVHHHGGSIEARSEEGQGTTFVLRFPLNPAQRPPLEENQQFLEKVLLNEKLWEKLMTAD